MPAFHHAFSAFVPRVTKRPIERIFSFKHETLHVGGAIHRYVDVVLLGSEGTTLLPFVRIAAEHVIWHEAHRAIGEEALSLLEAPVGSWALSRASDTAPSMEVLARDPVLERIAADESPDAPVVAGLAVYDRLFTEAERYAQLAPYLAGLRAIDLRPRFYGASLLAQRAASYAAVEDFSHAALFPQLHVSIDEEPHDYDVALALDVAPSAIDATLERARSAIHAGGKVLLSVRGSERVQLLRERGADVQELVRAGGAVLGELDETLGVWYARLESPAVAQETTAQIMVSPAPLKVLFALRPSSIDAFGGDVVQIRETAKALERLGHHVVVSTDAQPRADGFDVVHLTNLTSPFETIEQARAVQHFSGPIVLMPIFIDHADETTWGMRTSQAIFAAATDNASLRQSLHALAKRTITTENIPAPPARADLMPHFTAAQIETLRIADFAIANAHSEMHRLYRYLACDIPYDVAPSCADATVYGAHRRGAFEAKYGIRDFVLTTGRLESRKNQVLLIEALRDLGYPLLCIGRGVDALYATLFRAYRGEAMVLPFMSEAELAGAYAAARVVALPSWDEVVSLTALNAAVSEASMVLTRNSSEHEYFLSDAEYCDPGDVASVRGALERAWNGHDDRVDGRRTLAARVRTEYTWDHAAKITEAAYYRLLHNNPRGTRRLEAGSTP